MKIIFFGTSHFAAQILEYLYQKQIEILAVVTRPDRPKGRSLQLLPPPVKTMAYALNPAMTVYQPERASSTDFASILQQHPADLFVVVAFGEILRENILSIPPKGCINIHASLLPKYRGAAPIQRCLMNGDSQSGVTIIEMVLKMDAGDMIAIMKTPVPEDMTFGELEAKLKDLACLAVSQAIQDIARGAANKIPQDETLVTYAPKITAEEEHIHWDLPAQVIHNQIRALSPYPGAWCYVKIGIESKRLKIKRSSVIESNGQPGEILSFGKEGWIVACGSQAIRLLEVQLEGKKTMKVDDFIKGMHQSLSFQV